MVDVKNLDEQPAEVRAAIESWKQAKPELDVMRREQEVEQAKAAEAAAEKWQEETSLLRHRLESATEAVPLSNGDSISIRTRFNHSETMRLKSLLGKYDEYIEAGATGDLNEVILDTLDIILANIPSGWLRGHVDDYSMEDMAEVFMHYIRKMQRRAGELKRVQDFLRARKGKDSESSSGTSASGSPATSSN